MLLANGKTYYWTAEVAEHFGVETILVWQWARKGKIPHHKLPGTRRYLFLLEEVEHFFTPRPAGIETTQHAEMTPREAKASGKAAVRRAREWAEGK